MNRDNTKYHINDFRIIPNDWQDKYIEGDIMNKELKPCVNDMCPYNNIEHSKTRNCVLAHFYNECKKYIIKKPESAWEMFGRLSDKYQNKFINKIVIYEAKERLKDKTNKFIDGFWIQRYQSRREQDAIKIMQEIEKELNDV